MSLTARYGIRRSLWSNWSRISSPAPSLYQATSDAPSTSRALSTSSETPAPESSSTSSDSVTPLESTSIPASLPSQNSASPRRARLNPYTSYPLPKKLNLPPQTDAILTYFTSLIMRDGKRHQAARTVANTLNNIHLLTHAAPLPILREAIERAGPSVRVVSQKQRNKSLMTPRPLSAKQRVGQAIRWIVQYSENRPDHNFDQRLAKEVLAIVTNPSSSNVMKKKEEVHKLALANRANASVRI